VKGRRVSCIDELILPGDYCSTNGQSVWFLLPDPNPGPEPPAEGLLHLVWKHRQLEHHVTSPPWDFVEHEDGSLEILGSIHTWDWTGWDWHGFLHAGHEWQVLSNGQVANEQLGAIN